MPQGTYGTSGWRGRARLALGLLAALVSLAAAGCAREEAARSPGPLRVVVSIPPLAWVVHALAPVGAEVTQITPVGVGCEGVDLTPGQVVAIDKADVVVMTGLGLEAQIDRALARSERPGRRVASFANAPGLAGRFIEDGAGGHDHSHHDHDHAHDHDHDHAHDHGTLDPHAWLDPTMMAAFAQGVFDQFAAAMEAVAPDANARAEAMARMRSALDGVLSECAAIDREFREGLASVSTRAFVTEHNGFSYLARRYDLTVAATIRVAHDAEPAPGDIEAAAKAAREQGALAIFVEPQYSQAGARRVAEVAGLRVLTLDSLGAGDYPAMMRSNLVALREGLGALPGEAAAGGEAR